MRETNPLRELLNLPSSDKVSNLTAELRGLGYACALLDLPYLTLRVATRDSELDITLRPAYIDVLGKHIAYNDAASIIRQVLPL